jgi:hypothetical protein
MDKDELNKVALAMMGLAEEVQRFWMELIEEGR